MKFRPSSLSLCLFAMASFACAQQSATSPSTPAQSPAQAPATDQTRPQNPDGAPGGSGFGRGMGMAQGLAGTVTEIAPDHFVVKNMSGESWTVKFTDTTWIMKQIPGTPPGAANSTPQQRFGSYERGTFKTTEIRVGDMVSTGGATDSETKTVTAAGVVVLDPTRAAQMRQMQANYGKTWLAGRVTAINETTITVQSNMESDARSFTVDENTTFRRRREPITLPDLQVGDNVRVEGAVKDGQFLATAVNVMMPRATGGPAPRQGPPPQ